MPRKSAPRPLTTDDVREIGRIVEAARAALFPTGTALADGGASSDEELIGLGAGFVGDPENADLSFGDGILRAMLDALAPYGWPLLDRLRAPDERWWLCDLLYSVRAADEIDGKPIRTKRSHYEGARYATATSMTTTNRSLGSAIVSLMVKAGARRDLEGIDARDKRWLRAIGNVDRTIGKRTLKDAK